MIYISHDEGLFLRSAHRNKFKVDQIQPVGCPFFEQARIVAFHQLKTSIEISGDPTVNVGQPAWSHAASLTKSVVYGLRVAILKPFDDYVEPSVHSAGAWLS